MLSMVNPIKWLPHSYSHMASADCAFKVSVTAATEVVAAVTISTITTPAAAAAAVSADGNKLTKSHTSVPSLRRDLFSLALLSAMHRSTTYTTTITRSRITAMLLLLLQISMLSALFFGSASAQVSKVDSGILQSSEIFIEKKSIEVNYGRTVYIDPYSDLQLHVGKGDRCLISVLETDSLSHKPGKLTPVRFPCQFQPHQVSYTHFGGHSPEDDYVPMQIRYDTETATKIIPFVLHIKLSFKPLEIVTNNLPLPVRNLLSYSQPFTRSNTHFTYDPSKVTCKVTVLSPATGLPKYGRIINDTTTLTMMDCDQFLLANVRYQHTARSKSPRKDYVPLLVEVVDQNGTLVKQEYFHKMIKIRAGKKNSAPKVNLDCTLILDVDQFAMTAITPEILAAYDTETPADQLIFNITEPLAAEKGFLISTDDPELPINSFRQKDIKKLKIVYKPPTGDSDKQRRVIEIPLQVIDNDKSVSKDINLTVVVRQMNSLAPVVIKNLGVQLLEGQSGVLSSTDNLQITDVDNINDVTITVIRGSTHGQIFVNNLPRKYFTPKDLDNNEVSYNHDGSDTFSDNIVFRMTDGTHKVDFLFPVTIYALDDEAPTLTVNTGLEIRKNELADITPFVLSASDIDSEDSAIRFVTEPPFSKQGHLLLRKFQVTPSEDLSGWKFVNGAYEKPVREFTQQDILDGKVFYRHVGPHHSDFVTDKMKFKLVDNGDPPNESQFHNFVFKIFPVDDRPPYLDSRSTLFMNVDDAKLTPFKKKFLRYTDDDSDDRQITYTITSPLRDTNANTLLDVGELVHCNKQKSKLVTFTQSQLNHHKACYKHPTEQLGLVARLLKFTFDVQDISGNVLKDQEFIIKLRSVSNKPPRVLNNGLHVIKNGEAVITTDILNAEDNDTKDKDIFFIIEVEPKHGVIRKNVDILTAGQIFSKQDIINRVIFYQNNGDEADSDKFSLTVTDSVHKLPVNVKVFVSDVGNKEAKFIRTADGNELLHTSIEVNEMGTVVITEDFLKTTVTDSDDRKFTFIITKHPLEGVILTQKFTRQDIINKKVKYQHTTGEIGTKPEKDSFELMLTDESDSLVVGGLKVEQIRVDVKILPVDNKLPVVNVADIYTVSESEKNPILTSHLNVHDKDTEDEDIICTLVVRPNFGYLENISPAPISGKSQKGIPISAFSSDHLRLGNINYVQSFHEGVEERSDSFIIMCSDGINFSERYVFPIVILPENDETPRLFMREFVVAEGMLLTIENAILNATDKDQPKDVLTFVIDELPKHGVLGKQTLAGTIKITNFTLSDIVQDSTILYEHDGSESPEDYFKFTLTDGKHNITNTLPITIILVDDETPRLTVNTGLEIEKIGAIKIISNKYLKAEDPDSENETIMYIVRGPPKYGYLQRISNGHLLRNLSTGDNFTQYDIDQKRIQYEHNGADVVRDIIKFDLTDNHNMLTDQYFYITVKGQSEVTQQIINRGVELPESGWITLTTDLLTGTNLKIHNKELQFVLTRSPTRGHLENLHKPGEPIINFSLDELAADEIIYVHTSNDEMKMDSLMFEVTDEYSQVMLTFRISLTDVDNKKPVLTFDVLRVNEGSSKLLSLSELKVDDRDTNDNNIEFTITQVPVHGNLLHNYSRIVTRFTQADIANNLISYQHDGSDTQSDSFSFMVTDGIHSDFYVFPDTSYSKRHPQTMNIEIEEVDNGSPLISVNEGASFLTVLENGKMGFVLSEDVLKSQDHDSQDEELRYSLTVPPKFGSLSNTEHGTSRITTWTQADINARNIRYVLNPESNATNDNFFFNIVDKDGNVLSNQPFHLNWAIISMEKNLFKVNEVEKLLNITLWRRGYVGTTCYITIQVEDGTAKVGEDVQVQYRTKLQFKPGQTENTWQIHIIDDNKFENNEKFYLKLSDPVMAIVEEPLQATVVIVDIEDESNVFIPEKEYRVTEKESKLDIPVYRTGDLSEPLSVICHTVQETAAGSPVNVLSSFSDYITRPMQSSSIIHFEKDESKKICTVLIIDDSLFETEERFNVSLSQPQGGHLGNFTTTVVFIEPDIMDEPVIYFGKDNHIVDESVKYIDVSVHRVGPDLSQASSVTLRSKSTNVYSAESGVDYITVDKVLTFPPGVTYQKVQVTILDDKGKPLVEGMEAFELSLYMPMGAILGDPSSSIIAINDSISDLPTMQFKQAEIIVDENENIVTASIVRSGDISHASTIRCYTRQGTALMMMDFYERPNSNVSIIKFEPGEREKQCAVKLMGDHIHEEEEEFYMVLGNPWSPSLKKAKVGKRNVTTIRLTDLADKPVIKFENIEFSVKEPFEYGEVAFVRIPVARYGDLSKTSVVRVHTEDGSAIAGRDYNGISRELVFSVNVSHNIIEIEVLHDNEKEMKEFFTVHLRPDQNLVAEVKQNIQAFVYIEERKKLADVTFPTEPIVISLRDYGNDLSREPIQGYPCICITPCNPRHPDFSTSKELCEKEGINDTLTRFRWRVSAPRHPDDAPSGLSNVEANTFFTSTKGITLDSIYFGPGSEVQCGARAVNVDGDPGLELLSFPTIISSGKGLCKPQNANSLDFEPFSAKLRYISSQDSVYANKIQITVTVPHQDGMLPAISTRHLSNFELILSPDGTRIGQHRCSNLLDYNEIQTNFGFISNQTQSVHNIKEIEPYQFNGKLRGKSALRFYRNLNLETCLWEFTSYYAMSELITICSSEISSDNEIPESKQSFMTLKLPLYLSYVFHSPDVPVGWQHFDTSSQLSMRFSYDTPSLWQYGIGSDTPAKQKGVLYPSSMTILNDGKLRVDFKSKALFHGLFVTSHLDSDIESMVVSISHPDLTFTLELLQSEQTYQEPVQTWRFTSDFGIDDYSGQYKVKLVSCTLPLSEEFNNAVSCEPQETISFDLPIRLQQISDPVPARFSLNTEFHLTQKRDIWLGENSISSANNDVFTYGNPIYGRINTDPIISQRDPSYLNLEMVFLCSGQMGYIPKYDPQNQEYGCVERSANLQYVFKILDRAAPYTTDKLFHNVSFNATFAREDSTAFRLTKTPGADGFTFSSAPLFQVSPIRPWFLHVIYTIRSQENASIMGKRSIEYHNVKVHHSGHRPKRSTVDIEGVGIDGKGTNMAFILLDPQGKPLERGTNKRVESFPMVPIFVTIAVLLLLFIVGIIVFLHQKRKTSTPPHSPANTFSSTGGKAQIVYANHNAKFDTEKTEV
ncbi:extracellular matrix protein 3 [Octopus bimaculoides]|uniref:extracellular matrix protein 3 n=1 Tax=Octopus bimaculoides TaxID=37653 RepID=UPI00071E23EB|nr:extracellular matrix protein 3 [Octopus bimaculoides]|eukprot:XP_014777556.1 PREDICTED: extracellular matrix protein 3-like [Octopus bimaculoides]